MREAIRFPHLAQNLRFAEQHGIEPRRNPKQMLHGFAIVVVIERHAEDIRTHRMEFAQKNRKSRGTLMGGFRRHTIHFAAIAGREHQSLFENSPSAELLRRPLGLLARERHLLTHLYGRCAMIQSDKNNFHSALQALLKVAVTLREI